MKTKEITELRNALRFRHIFYWRYENDRPCEILTIRGDIIRLKGGGAIQAHERELRDFFYAENISQLRP